MAFYSGFQSNAFQNNAWQIGSGVTPPEQNTDGGGYVHPYQDYKAREYQKNQAARLRAELKQINDELARKEQERLKAKALNEAMKAAEQAALEAMLLVEIDRLRMERAWLMRRIDDEEAALVLMLSSPFH